MFKVVLVANDVSPSRALSALAESLSKQGFVVTGFLGMGKLGTHPAVIDEAIRGASMVLVGMSSTPELAEMELHALGTAKAQGIRYGLYADTFGAHRREHFAPHRAGTSLLFVASDAEDREGHELFPSAHVVQAGHPDWEDLIDSGVNEEDIRLLFPDREKKIVLVPFNKTHETNYDLVSMTISALHHENVHIVAAIHPGEQKQDPEATEKYVAEISRLHRLYLDVTCGLLPSGLTAKDVLRIASVVVSACSPTTDLQAALLNVPVINYLGHSETKARIVREFGEGGYPPLCSIGAAYPAWDDMEIEFAYHHRLEALKRDQRIAFPVTPKKGHAVIQMTNAFLFMHYPPEALVIAG